jgi:hypothetical protein
MQGFFVAPRTEVRGHKMGRPCGTASSATITLNLKIFLRLKISYMPSRWDSRRLGLVGVTDISSAAADYFFSKANDLSFDGFLRFATNLKSPRGTAYR